MKLEVGKLYKVVRRDVGSKFDFAPAVCGTTHGFKETVWVPQGTWLLVIDSETIRHDAIWYRCIYSEVVISICAKYLDEFSERP